MECVMKNTMRIIGIISLMLVIGLAFFSCDSGSGGGTSKPSTPPPPPPPLTDPALNGTWKHTSGEKYTFNNGTFEIDSTIKMKGTFTTSGTTFTTTLTHLWGSGSSDGFGLTTLKWYTKAEAIEANSSLATMFTPTLYTYVISGSTLTLTEEGYVAKNYTKQ